jgi:hypothetical protein
VGRRSGRARRSARSGDLPSGPALRSGPGLSAQAPVPLQRASLAPPRALPSALRRAVAPSRERRASFAPRRVAGASGECRASFGASAGAGGVFGASAGASFGASAGASLRSWRAQPPSPEGDLHRLPASRVLGRGGLASPSTSGRLWASAGEAPRPRPRLRPRAAAAHPAGGRHPPVPPGQHGDLAVRGRRHPSGRRIRQPPPRRGGSLSVRTRIRPLRGRLTQRASCPIEVRGPAPLPRAEGRGRQARPRPPRLPSPGRRSGSARPARDRLTKGAVPCTQLIPMAEYRHQPRPGGSPPHHPVGGRGRAGSRLVNAMQVDETEAGSSLS